MKINLNLWFAWLYVGFAVLTAIAIYMDGLQIAGFLAGLSCGSFLAIAFVEFVQSYLNEKK